ncbi:MAG: sulfotransferase, partial [Gammaproteobacteria bacterium]
MRLALVMSTSIHDSMIELRSPNLFIVGAPKCGTTAMSHYLAGHTRIFMSESELPRLFRRLQPLREWSDEHVNEIFTGSTRTGGADGARAPRRA